LENQLPENFRRVHKSYILNTEKVKSICLKKAVLISEQEIPIGESYKMNLLDKIK